MAEETNPQGNIRQEYNNATVGLNLDQSINQIKPGTLTYALNAAVENFDSNSVNYQNEQGNELCVSFPEDYVLIGSHFIQEKNKHIFFLVNDSLITGGSEIGYMENNDCVYHTLTNAVCLNFKLKYPIHKIVHRITNCTTEIYWTDAFNSRRYLNIEEIPYTLASGTNLCNPILTDELDCNQIKVQSNFSIPTLIIKDVVPGGNLKAGTVQFAIQYSDASGNPFTSYYSITNPTPIADPSIITVDYNYNVGKSVIVDIKNLDVTGQFQYYNLAVIKTVNAITSVELIGTYFIEEGIDRVTYNGQDVTAIRLTIADIFEKYPYYDVAEDLTSAQDVLIWDGLSSSDRLSYQSIASQIALKWETYEIPFDENYADELNATNLRGYLRDEVYAFEIVFLLNNGKQTDGFHIPGREISDYDRSFGNVSIDDPDFIGEPVDNEVSSPWWKIYNTATVSNSSTGVSINNATPYEYGEFAYWESTEKYPCNEGVWGDLSEKPIRHHKFPDVLVSPIFKNPEFILGGGDAPVMQSNATFPIGVKVDITQIDQLIQSSNLTSEQKSEIAGYKIVRGDRNTNRSIIGKGILRNVGKYKREDQSYYYPNYPYNDLNKDPFLNTTNNAWSQISDSFTINVISFNLPVGNPTYLEVKYSDPNTNKPATEQYKTKGIKTLCSVGVPIIQGIGLKNSMVTVPGGLYKPAVNCIGTVSYSNYDKYYISTTGSSAGWRASWEDAIPGLILDGSSNSSPTEVFLPGGLFGGRSYLVNTRVGTTPIKLEGGSATIQARGESRNTDCEGETSQPAIDSNDDLAYRQIFNSPETSFGQPFLGTVLKLENVMFGAGKAHFTEVKKNAKYKLLTEEAQQDALDASEKLGSVSNPFSASAMFAAYQSYLTIYINGITRKNYAYSFNSIASYDYFRNIDNGQGIKQRKIDLKQYLIPGVQSVGDENININNYQREASVFIKTVGTDSSNFLPALPFPNKTPNLAPSGTSLINDQSRFTISGSENCAAPSKDKEITVVSYYASLKNVIPGQWGQIYSYVTIDTGFQRMFNDISVTANTIFGGDTFISRFAFKTKLPFFIDNRVGAPDDSDVFYDEIGNIAYPKYWHSARSILKDYNSSPESGYNLPTTLSNIISYKATNFDCKNSQEPGPTSTPSVPADQNPNRTFYDGYFYLFAYGIPNFYCESSYNIDLRQAYDNRVGDFWPHVSTGIPDDWVQESYVSIANDNTYTYNATFSKQNKENLFTHLPPDWKIDESCFTVYPFRTIYSEPQATDADNRVNNWLTYRAVSYFDFPQNFGKLISLDGIQNKAVLARFENKSLMYNNLLTINTSNPQAAYLGNPNLFRGGPPIDFAETDLGYVGTQNKFLLKIPQGQITVDAKRGQIFLISGTQAVDLTTFGSGMNRFFTDHLSFEILRYFPKADTDNHFNGVGLHGVFDSKFDRIIITKLDYIPLNNDIKYDEESNEFYIEQNEVRTQLFLTDSAYFYNRSWTISFNFNTKSWVSFHSYLPNFYIGENNFFYSGLNGFCEEFDFIAGPIVADPTTTTTTTVALDCTIAGSVSIVYPTTTTTTSARVEFIPSLVNPNSCFPGDPSGVVRIIGGSNGDTIKVKILYSGMVGTDGAAYNVQAVAQINSQGPLPVCFNKDTGIQQFSIFGDVMITLTGSSMDINTSVYYANGTTFTLFNKYVQIVEYNGNIVNGDQLSTICSGNSSGSTTCG
tara:strand:- start:901 stop:6027 length:5127 start_codon:yes stop_codon:yes gene_type:complete